MRHRRIVLAVWALAAFGCDAPVAPDDPDAGPPLVAPALDPVLTPCAPGWIERAGTDGLARCTAPEPEPCGPGQAWHAPAGGCTRIGPACPDGDGFPADLPASGVIHVRAGSAGDGSRAAPFGTIASAMAVAGEGTTIAIAPGRYDEAVAARNGVSIRGACTESVVLAWSRPRGGASVTVDGVGGSLRGLRIERSDNLGVLVRRGGALELEEVIVDDAMLIGVAVLEGSRLDARRLAVRGTRPTADLALGQGVVVEGSQATIDDLILERNTEIGARASGVGARLEVNGLTAVESQPGVGVPLGAGVAAGEGGELVVRRGLIHGGVGAGALALGGGALTLEAVEVRGVRASREGEQGFGVSAHDAHLVARAVHVHGTTGTGIGAYEGSTLALSDALVHSIQPSGPRFATGIHVAFGSRGTLARVRVEGSDGAAILVAGYDELPAEPVELDAEDVSVVDAAGIGVAVQNVVTLTVRRLRIDRSTELAMGVSYGAHAVLSDVWIRDTIPERSTGEFGRGLEVLLGGDVEMTRALFERQHEASVIVGYGRLRASELTIVDTRARACAETTCPDAPGGIGVGAYAGADVEVREFTIDGARLCGVQVHGGGELDLRQGIIAHAPVGACVQNDGYDITRLTDGVQYRDNGVAVQATTYAPPEPSELRFDL